MKTLFTFATAMLCLWVTTYGQDLATWNLTTNVSPDFIAPNTKASDLLRGGGISDISITGAGAGASSWTTAGEPKATDYFEVCVEPNSGYTLQVDDISFTEQRSNDGITAYELHVSSDDFQTETVLLQETVPDNMDARTSSLTKLDLISCDQQQICFRWYGFGSEDEAGSWSLSDINITGTATAECTPPVQQVGDIDTLAGNITSTTADLTWEHEEGEDLLIIVREEGQPAIFPCSGTDFVPNTTFGSGTDFGQGNYVVYEDQTDMTMSGTFTVEGLESGQTYVATAVAYDPITLCYLTANAPSVTFNTDCAAPSAPGNLQGHPGGEIAYLSWSEPLCYDEVLLVGSDSAITILPTSSDGGAYSPSTEYGTGMSSNGDFPNGVYPLYQGTATQVTITALSNSTTYYFRLYARFDGVWLAGPEVTVTPKETCSNGDYLFLSELHYNNVGMDIDEGVEVTGEAGLDLSRYQIDYYSQSSYVGTVHLSGTLDDQIDGVGAYWVPIVDLDDNVNAVCLYNKVSGQIVELFTNNRFLVSPLVGGVADGITPPSIEQQQSDSTSLNRSLQRNGDGACPTANSVWGGPFESSRGLINTSGAPLPISLLDFSAQRAGDQVRLRWQTATELNNDYMAVEHSVDGRSFTEIGRVSGAGTTQEPQQYTLTHTEPAAGVNYYRLRQVDFDGQFEYFGPVSVRLPGSTAVLQLYPTATRNQLTLDFTNPKREAGEFLIFNTLGQLQRQIPHDGGSTRMPVDVSTLPAGQYTLLWRSKRQPLVAKRFTKL
ncbi:MAG TPA: hypothetical protein VJ933_10245 [Phaeodactylibacter sp.]|nr:hypothetical protein [Phaeodactylibacter sp.]